MNKSKKNPKWKIKIGWILLLQIIIFSIGFFVSNYLVLDIIKQKVTLTDFQGIIINIVFALFFLGLSIVIEKFISFIKEIERKIDFSVKKLEEQTDVIARGNRMSDTYKKLSSLEFSSELHQFMVRVKSDETDFDGHILQLAEKISKGYLEKNVSHELWYIIYYQYLMDELKSIEYGQMNIHLNSYLKIYLEFMNYYIEKCKREELSFHIVSFTNAIPTDWFKESRITGGKVIDFRKQKVDAIKKMKENGHKLKMYVLSSNSLDLEAMGVKSKPAIRKDWLKLSNEERKKYLNELHTLKEDALLLNLKLDNLKFNDNLTEFIYFGIASKEQPTNIKWEWCISGSYSRYTNNLLANFNYLENDGDNLIIDVENKNRILLDRRIDFSPPARLQVSYKNFPNHILNDKISETISFNEIFILQDKWILASEIFHTDKEKTLFKEWVLDTYPNKDIRVLDSSAGTGIHLQLLNDLGYSNIYGSEYQENEVEILKQRTSDFLNANRIFKADWNDLSGLNEEKFDLIFCIGTSIPYYKSWGEINGHNLTFDEKDVKEIIKNFVNHLNDKGQMIFGLSRKNSDAPGYVTRFDECTIDDVKHKMIWEFDFDWVNKAREWNCIITRDDNLDFSFKAVGHLFNVSQLKDWCEEVFPKYKVDIVDYDPNKETYDLFVIITKSEDV